MDGLLCASASDSFSVVVLPLLSWHNDLASALQQMFEVNNVPSHNVVQAVRALGDDPERMYV